MKSFGKRRLTEQIYWWRKYKIKSVRKKIQIIRPIQHFEIRTMETIRLVHSTKNKWQVQKTFQQSIQLYTEICHVKFTVLPYTSCFDHFSFFFLLFYVFPGIIYVYETFIYYLWIFNNNNNNKSIYVNFVGKN